MTAAVYTYIGAGGKTTSLFARARQERAAGHRVAVVTTTHMMRPDRWFVPADLPTGWQDPWQRDGIVVVGIPERMEKSPGLETTFTFVYARQLTSSSSKGTDRGACP